MVLSPLLGRFHLVNNFIINYRIISRLRNKMLLLKINKFAISKIVKFRLIINSLVIRFKNKWLFHNSYWITIKRKKCLICLLITRVFIIMKKSGRDKKIKLMKVIATNLLVIMRIFLNFKIVIHKTKINKIFKDINWMNNSRKWKMKMIYTFKI